MENKEGKILTVKRTDKSLTVTDKVSGRHLIYALNEDKMIESVKDGTGRTAHFYYDDNKCLKQFTNAAESAVRPYRYVYNEKGLLTEKENAIGNRTQYQYNAKLLLEEMTDSADEKTSYTYDSLNRLKTVKDELGTITYTYDLNGNVTEVSEKEGIFSAAKTIRRTFDGLNRMTSYTDYQGRVVRYGYDELGNMTVLTYPGGETVRYEYHEDGSVAKMESSSGGTFTYAYDSYGRLCRITRQDGSVEERTYDAAGQLLTQTDTDREGNILQENIYEYNVFGEVITKKTTSTQHPDVLETVSMTYNDANRFVTYNGQKVIINRKRP